MDDNHDRAILNAPKFLDKPARSLWRRFAPALHEAGFLTACTRDMVASMVQHYSIYLACVLTLREEGRVLTSKTGAIKSHPLCTTERNAWDCYAKAFKELQIGKEPPAPTTPDELREFLNPAKCV
jgi:P27 family predicted phage terminase small subunit